MITTNDKHLLYDGAVIFTLILWLKCRSPNHKSLKILVCGVHLFGIFGEKLFTPKTTLATHTLPHNNPKLRVHT